MQEMQGRECGKPPNELEFLLPGGMKFGMGIDLNNIFTCLNLETNKELFLPWGKKSKSVNSMGKN